MKRRSARPAAVLLVVAASLACAVPARAAEEWHDGVPAQSSVYNPCLGITEFGALAAAGYLTDPATTHAGDVFYAHAVFGAATYVGGNCTTTDQAAEIDLVLPPGVSLAIDAQHPIQCFFQDGDGAPLQTDPTCPTHTIPGVYGPQLPAGDGGAGWDMPPGRTLQVAFPLVSNRELKGPAGGTCPDTLDEISAFPQRDCLLLAVHMLDGTDDPWLLPNEQMVLAPAATGPAGPTGPAPPAAPAKPALAVPHRVRLSALLAKGLPLTLTLPGAGATAKVTVKLGRHTLGTLTRRHLAAGRVTLRVRLSKAGRARLRHAKRAHLTVVETLSSPAATLHAGVLAKR